MTSRTLNALATLLTVIAAGPAWAVGERLLVGGAEASAVAQLKETLCVSMECVGDIRSMGVDVTVEAKVAKGLLQIDVASASGKHYATVKAELTDGRLGAMDLVSATSQILRAIEYPEARAAAAPAPAKARPSKWAKGKKAKAAKFRLAAR